MPNKWGVNPDEAAVLTALEQIYGKSIPLVAEFESCFVGVQVAGETIIGLALRGCGLTTLHGLTESSKSLAYLDLANNLLATLPESLGELKSLKTLYLYGNQLTTLPESFGQLESLQTLNVTNNKLTTLPKSFGRLKSLTYLFLDENQLETLPESFGQLESLQNLSLTGNKLTTLPESFGALISLQILFLRDNQLTTLPASFGALKSLKDLRIYETQLATLPESFGQLKSLTALILEQGQLTTLPESFGQLESLQTLSLFANQLTILPESFGRLKSLQKLSLSLNRITTLPESFGQLKSLQILYLTENQLTALPASFGRLESLQNLSLSTNKLTTLPDSFGQLKSLQTLDVIYNKLATLPKSFGQLQSLKALYLSHNQLTTLPEPILQLKSLQELSLSQNHLTTLPKSLGQLKSLQTLDLTDTQLTTLPEPILQLKSLQELSLSQNHLTTLPESLGQLKSLQTLDLTDTQLTTLPEPILQLKSLQKLILRQNQLTTLPESLGQLKSLQTLDVTNNKLTTLPESFRQLEALIELHVDGNPFQNHEQDLITKYTREEQRWEKVIRAEGLEAIRRHCQVKRILHWEKEHQRSIEKIELIRELHINFENVDYYYDLLNASGEYLTEECPQLGRDCEEAVRNCKIEVLTLYELVVEQGFDISTAKKVGQFLLDRKVIKKFPRIPSAEETKPSLLEVTRGFQIAGDCFKFFIKLFNCSKYVISHIAIKIRLPPMLKLDEKSPSEQLLIGDLGPNERYSAIFYLYCVGCTDTVINAVADYTDPWGVVQVQKMDPFQIITCKWVQPRKISNEEFQQKLERIEKKEVQIPIQVGIPPVEVIRRIKERMSMSIISEGSGLLKMFGTTKDEQDVGLQVLIEEVQGIKTLISTVFSKNQQIQMGILSDVREGVQDIKSTTKNTYDFLRARYSIPLILDPSILEEIKTKRKQKFYAKITCLYCGQSEDLMVEEKDRTWVKVGKTLCHGVLCGAAAVSLLGSIPVVIGQIKTLVSAVQQLKVDSVLTSLKSLGGNIEEIRDQIKLFSGQKQQIGLLSRNESDILSYLDDLFKNFNDNEIQELRTLFYSEANAAVSNRFAESKYRLFVHKECQGFGKLMVL